MSNQDKITNIVYINSPLCIAKKALSVCVCVCGGKSREVIFYKYYYSLNLKTLQVRHTVGAQFKNI